MLINLPTKKEYKNRGTGYHSYGNATHCDIHTDHELDLMRDNQSGEYIPHCLLCYEGYQRLAERTGHIQ